MHTLQQKQKTKNYTWGKARTFFLYSFLYPHSKKSIAHSFSDFLIAFFNILLTVPITFFLTLYLFIWTLNMIIEQWRVKHTLLCVQVCMCVYVYVCVAPHIQLISKHCWHLKHICCIFWSTFTARTIINVPNMKNLHIYFDSGSPSMLSAGPQEAIFINLWSPQGKMSRVETGSFLWVLKISRRAWGCKWGLKSLLASRAHLGCKAFMWAHIYPFTFEYQLELPAMSKRNFRFI